jgi:phosphate:Na+ symporter
MIDFLELFGGVGLFLFGMNLMGSSLKKLAGAGLEKILQTLTTSKKKGVGELKGWGLGLGVTGIIQSSAATTIMLIGFVNAGIMTLAQAIPVVYGSNVGSTVTAQILRLGDLGSGSLVLQLLKPSSFAPMLVALGIAIRLMGGMRKDKGSSSKLVDLAGIFIGLGTLFYGMTIMEEVFIPLKESESFRNLFLAFNNPFIGILIGLVLTAVIQSSSAAVGILQALSATGSVTFGSAIPIIIGTNIGKCFTILLGSIGANKQAKRVALSYLLFNIVGAVFYTVVIYLIYYTVGIPAFGNAVNRGDIANLHLAFNLIISVVLLPFSKKMADVTAKIIKENEEPKEIEDEDEFRHLDDMLLKTPGIALTQCKNLMRVMAERIQENYQLASGLISEYDKSAFDRLNKNEAFIDKCETVLSAYIVKIDRKRLTIDNSSMASAMLNTIGDYERIGDYCMNIAYTAQDCQENKVQFSEKGISELRTILEATGQMIEMTFTAVESENKNKAFSTQPLSKVIDELKVVIESHHVDRLQTGDCGVQGGVALYDITNCLQRIALHSKSISKHTMKRLSRDNSLDPLHGSMIDKKNEEYLELEKYYYSKYIEPMKKEPVTYIDEQDEQVGAENNELTKSDSKKKDIKDKKSKDKKSAKKEDKKEDEKDDKKEDKKEDKKDSKKADKKSDKKHDKSKDIKDKHKKG